MNADTRAAVAAAKHVETNGSWVDVAREVVAGHQFVVADALVLDQFSASVMLQVHDALSAENQAKFAAMSLDQAQRKAFQLVAEVRS